MNQNRKWLALEVEESLLREIDRWRYRSEIPSRAAAVRQLLTRALALEINPAHEATTREDA